MLFNLNSIDEPNPRNFKNRLSDNIVIKPNSYVCLTGATITRVNHIQKILLQNNTTLDIKLMPYDVAQISLAAGEYTIDQFCTLVNNNFTKFNGNVDRFGDICALVSMNAVKIGNPTDFQIDFEFKKLGNDGNEMGVYDVLGINQKFAFFKVQSILGQSNPTIKPPGSLGNIGLSACSILGGDNASYACAGFVSTEVTPYNPYGYTPPPNQENNLALNMAATDDDYIANSFYIAQPNLRNIKFLAGKANYDVANTRYSSAATFGSAGWSDPNGAVNNCPFYLSFKDTGAFDFYVLNKNTGSFDTITADQAYEPGDFINLAFAESSAPINLGDGRIMAPFVSHLQGNGLGLLYMMQLNVGGANVRWNSTNSKIWDLTEFINAELNNIRSNNWTAYNAFWQARGGVTRPIGVRIGTGVQAESTYADCNNNQGFLWKQNSDQAASLVDLQTGNANSKLNGTPLFQRYSAGAAPSVNPDVRSHLLISPTTASGGILLKSFPYMMSFYFRLVDDTAKLPGGSVDEHTFINSVTGQRIVTVFPANGAAQDVQIRMDGGATFNYSPLDSGATRINIAYGTDYYMAVKYTGTTHQQIIIDIVDMATGVSYTQTQVVGAANIENVASIGHQETNPAVVSNYGKSFNGYFGHFRIHTRCQNASFLTTTWDSLFTDLTAYLISGTISGNVWFGYREAVLGNNSPQYLVVGNIDSSRTLTPVFHKDTLSIPADNTWGDFINPYFRHSYYVRNDRRITNLDVHDYQSDVIGLLNVSTLNTGDSASFSFPDEDVRGNVVKQPDKIQINQLLTSVDPILADVENVQLDDKTVYVEIPNLPHRSYNGVNKTQDKTIGVVPVTGVNADVLERDNLDIITTYPPTKNWIPLNNPGEIILNELQVKLSDVRGKELDATEITQETSVSIQIEERDNIFS